MRKEAKNSHGYHGAASACIKVESFIEHIDWHIKRTWRSARATTTTTTTTTCMPLNIGTYMAIARGKSRASSIFGVCVPGGDQ